MKAITFNVSEPIYAMYQAEARRRDRSTAELIREAMEKQILEPSANRPSVLTFSPLSLGRAKKPLEAEDDILGEMLNDSGD